MKRQRKALIMHASDDANELSQYLIYDAPMQQKRLTDGGNFFQLYSGR